jgi:hypothetical protein
MPPSASGFLRLNALTAMGVGLKDERATSNFQRRMKNKHSTLISVSFQQVIFHPV